jgi:cellulose synthase operon protein C
MIGAPMQSLSAGAGALTRVLSQAAFEPVSGRLAADDDRFRELVAEVERLLADVSKVGGSVDPGDELLHLHGEVARVLGEAAAVLVAASAGERARGWLERARELVPLPGDRAVFDEALQRPELFRQLMQAQWQYAHGSHESARKLALAALRAAAGSPAIAVVAEGIASIEAPLVAAPTMRRNLVLLGCAVLAIGGGWYWYLHTPGYKLTQALDAARARETQAKTTPEREAAIAHYESLIEKADEKLQPAKLAPAALGIARLLHAGLPHPLPPSEVDQAMKSLQRFASIPSKNRAGEPTDFVCQKTQGFATAFEAQGTDGLYAARRLLGKANRLCPSTSGPALKRVRLTLARLDAKDWPLVALAEYAQFEGVDESVTESAKLIDAIADNEVSIWREAATPLASWLKATQGLPDQAERAARVRERMAAAEAYFGSAERQALEKEPTVEALTKAVAAQPGDQELQVALAGHEPDAAALDRLTKLGSPGRLTRSTALELAELLQRLGKLLEAENILEHLVHQMLPDYEHARADYAETAAAFYAKWYEKARSGELPDDIDSELKRTPEDQASTVFDKWVGQRADEDPEVRVRFERVEQTNRVVPTVLSLGTVKLLLASQQTGAEQAQTLTAAERLFLAIGSDATGVPAYHMGLAQVYYRLGKIAEGEREFGELLSKAEPHMALSVARAYREVGAITRAREVTEGVYTKTTGAEREAAALLMSLMADGVEDRRTWLQRADQHNPLVKTNLLELEADAACSDGRAQEGDKKYKDAAAQHLEGSKLDESNFNNAALAQAARVGCTGQRAPLDEAIALMHKALRIAPDSSLLAENAVPLHEFRGMLRVLSRWVDPAALQLDSADASNLLDALEDGPHRAELLRALKDDADVKRARELARNARVLAPTHPDPYQVELAWLDRFEDGPGLTALLAMVRAQKLDTQQLGVMRKQWLDGKLDSSRRDRMHKEEAKLKRLIESLPAAQARGLAALRLLEGELATSLMTLDAPLPRAEQALRAFETADQLWPALGAQRRLPQALLVTAAVRAGATRPALASRLHNEMREYGWSILMGRLVDEADAATIASIKAQPEFARAAELARAANTEHPISWDYLIARLAGDAAAADRVAPRLFTAQRRVGAELNRLLNPGNASDAYVRFTDLHMPKAVATP